MNAEFLLAVEELLCQLEESEGLLPSSANEARAKVAALFADIEDSMLPLTVADYKAA